MNTMRRPRRRPRKSSVSFRTLGWLLTREAYFNIAHPGQTAAAPALRHYIVEAHSTGQLQRWAAQYITHAPERRYFP